MPTIKILRCHTVPLGHEDRFEIGQEFRLTEDYGTYIISVPYLTEGGVKNHLTTLSKAPEENGLSYATWFTLAEIQL